MLHETFNFLTKIAKKKVWKSPPKYQTGAKYFLQKKNAKSKKKVKKKEKKKRDKKTKKESQNVIQVQKKQEKIPKTGVKKGGFHSVGATIIEVYCLSYANFQKYISNLRMIKNLKKNTLLIMPSFTKDSLLVWNLLFIDVGLNLNCHVFRSILVNVKRSTKNDKSLAWMRRPSFFTIGLFLVSLESSWQKLS